MRTVMLALATAMGVLAGGSNGAWADIPIRIRTEAERAQFSRAAQRTMAAAVQSFRPFLTPEQAVIADTIRFESPLSITFQDAYATITNGVHRIVIGVGFLETIEMVEDGAILTVSFGIGDLDTLRKYVDYVADRIGETASASSLGHPLTAIAPYWAFAHAPEARVAEVYASDFYNSVFLSVCPSTS